MKTFVKSKIAEYGSLNPAFELTPDPVLPSEIVKFFDRSIRPGLPKYIVLRDAIILGVASGRLLPGQRLPNEQVLAEVLPISLGTIQRGLRQLVGEGIVQRRHGQGSFIVGRGRDAGMAHPFHCRFMDGSGSSYLRVFPEIIGRSRLSVPDEWSHELHASEGVEITRRIRIDTEFSVYSSFIVDGGRLPLFAQLPLKELNGENFKDVIFRSCGQMVHRIDIRLRQLPASAEVAEIVEVAPGTLCTSMKSVAHLGENDPIYFQQILFPPTNRELHIVSDGRLAGII